MAGQAVKYLKETSYLGEVDVYTESEVESYVTHALVADYSVVYDDERGIIEVLSHEGTRRLSQFTRVVM